MAWLEIEVWFREVSAYEMEAVGDHYELFVHLPPDRSVTIGRMRTGGPQLIHIGDTLARRHMEIVPTDGGSALRDLMSTGGSYINDDRVLAGQGPRALVAGDRIYLGAPAREPAAVFHPGELEFACTGIERDLATAVRERHVGARSVYADWLEERGEHARARFLRERERLEAAPPSADEPFSRAQKRSREWSALDPSWRRSLLGPHLPVQGHY